MKNITAEGYAKNLLDRLELDRTKPGSYRGLPSAIVTLETLFFLVKQ